MTNQNNVARTRHVPGGEHDVLAAKLADLAERIERAQSRCPTTVDALRADRDALDIVSYNLMLALQSCVDIAGHLIADASWPVAPSLSAAFERLHEKGVLSSATAAALARAVGLRDVIACSYETINPAVVHAAATRGVADLEAFAREVAAWAATRRGS